jgi:hypothetical protein
MTNLYELTDILHIFLITGGHLVASVLMDKVMILIKEDTALTKAPDEGDSNLGKCK